jgi:hypothetical protein
MFSRIRVRARLAGAPQNSGGLFSRLLLGSTLAALIGLVAPAGSQAAITTFGSPLSVAATLNTSENLNYQGTNTPVPANPEAPNGVYHTYHFGADTALWSVAQANGMPSAPTAGQAIKVSLEGCAEAASSGPAPLTQIHFQDITPVPGGGAKVNLTSGGFNIPVCGQNGASGSTVSSYEPYNLCVSKGDYIAFNDEGGYVENVYRNGVPYEVLGAVSGSTTDSFIKGGGTDNGDVMSSSDQATMEGFASNANEELMMQVTLGTGPDARYVCPGGTKEAPPVLAPMDIHPQTDGINAQRVVAVAIYCRLAPACDGVATLTMGGKRVSTREINFSVPSDTTGHVSIRLVPSVMGPIRKHHGIVTTITAVVDDQTFTQTVGVKIF